MLPTRDLVNQVRETFEAIGKGRTLKVGLFSAETLLTVLNELQIGTATGQHSFAHEQAQFIADKSLSSVFCFIDGVNEQTEMPEDSRAVRAKLISSYVHPDVLWTT